MSERINVKAIKESNGMNEIKISPLSRSQIKGGKLKRPWRL
jgi:hypothetical protein